jgi:hypothetical protein
MIVSSFLIVSLINIYKTTTGYGMLVIEGKIHNFAEDHGETNVLKRESGEKPELCPQRYVL